MTRVAQLAAVSAPLDTDRRYSLDTSVVLRLLTGLPEEQAHVARQTLAAASHPVAIDDVVVAECYHALRHHYRVPHIDAVQALHLFVSSASVRATGQARHVLAASATRSTPGFVDQLIHATAVARDETLLTFDRALARLSAVRLLA